MNLNDGQRSAQSHKDGPMMVLAGPGSGKTTVITYRVKHLIEHYGVKESEILVITFSKSAATDMKNRFANIMPNSGVLFSTFHALFFKILRAHTTVDIDNLIREDHRLEVIKAIVKEQGLDHEDKDFLDELSQEISLVKNDLLDMGYYNPKSVSVSDFKEIAGMYDSYKRENNRLDFDDMLTRCYELLSTNDKVLKIWQRKYKYIMIDEFQDINKAQYVIIKLLSEETKNVYIVGDDDQSIYRFRGARPEFLLNFPKDFENVQRALLDINYRSTNEIIKFSNQVIKQNKVRYDKTIQGTGKEGKVPVILKHEDINHEAISIANIIKTMKIDYEDICVIYRTNMQARGFIDAFSLINVPYNVKDGVPPIYDHFVAKDICAYLLLALDGYDENALIRIINKPKRYISKGVIAVCKKSGLPLIDELFETRHLQFWQKKPLEELLLHLRNIKNQQTPDKAIKYIRKKLGYDDYIKDYANYKKVNTKGLFEILDELQESSKNFESFSNYIEHNETMLNVYKEQRANRDMSQVRGVNLSTMHGAKGLEYKVVFVISCVEGVVPYEKSKTAHEIEEERRMFYVAITRPKEMLYISTIETRYEDKVKPSRFLLKGE